VVAQVTDRGGDVVHPSLRFWLLYVAPLGSSSFTLVPWGCPGEDKLSDHLQTLPDFNHREFLEAKFCTEKQSFLCWQRPIHTQSP
jgi:hypothetical protein